MSYWNVVKGLLSGGNSKPIRSTVTGDLSVEIDGANTSAFGDIATAENFPLIQMDWVVQPVTAGVMTQIGGAFITNSGAAGVDAGRLKLNTTSSTNATTAFMSNKIARYRAGQGITARFTSVFANGGVATSTQITGMGVPTITWTNNAVAPGAPITAITVDSGYFFGYNNTTFGIRHKNSRTAGDDWTAQTAWNVDVCDGTSSASNPSGFNLNPTLGNVYQIKYPYLGYGDIKFFIQNSTTGHWTLVHVIRYTNSSASVQLGNPSLNFISQIVKTAGATDITLYTGSVGVFLNGERNYLGPQFGWDARVTGLSSGVETPIFSIRAATSVNGSPNRGTIRLRSVSISADGANTDTRLRIRRNAALTNSTFANAVYGTITASSTGFILTAAQSITTVDTAATAIAAQSAGASDVLFNAVCSRSTGYEIDLTQYDLFCIPGDTLNFTGTTFSANNNIQIACNWNEDT